MKKQMLHFTLAIWLMPVGFLPWNLPNQTHIDYINKYKDIAIKEMQRTGIPASIKLAQAILESGAGTSELSRNANNHFGIKCHSDWQGEGYFRIDDDRDANGNLIPSCFRVYSNPEESFIAHSDHLRSASRQRIYGPLFQLDALDYRAWARGLQGTYATNPNYANLLINIIERYELYQYDQEAMGRPIVSKPPTTVAPPAPVYNTQNDVRYTVALPNETLADIAVRTATSIDNLLLFNDQFEPSGSPTTGARVYVQAKRAAYRGRDQYHQVGPGETMFDIAQAYGVQLARLYYRNRMEVGTQPAVQERIKLRGWRTPQPPKLATQKSENEPLIKELEYLFSEPIRPVNPPVPNPTTINQEEVPNLNAESEQAKDNEAPVMPEAPSNEQFHTVVAGDTLWNISQRYNTTVEILRRLNGLRSNNIRVGDRLRIR